MTSARDASADCLAASAAAPAQRIAAAARTTTVLLSLLLRQDESWQGRRVLFSPPRPPSCVFAVTVLPPLVDWPLAVLRVHEWRICTGEIEAIVTSACLKNRPGPEACSDALQKFRQEAGNGRAVAPPPPLLFVYSCHQAEVFSYNCLNIATPHPLSSSVLLD